MLVGRPHVGMSTRLDRFSQRGVITGCCGINTRRYQAQSLLLWSLRPPSSPSSSDLLLRLSALRFNSHNLISVLSPPSSRLITIFSTIVCVFSPSSMHKLKSRAPLLFDSHHQKLIHLCRATPSSVSPESELRHQRKAQKLHTTEASDLSLSSSHRNIHLRFADPRSHHSPPSLLLRLLSLSATSPSTSSSRSGSSPLTSSSSPPPIREGNEAPFKPPSSFCRAPPSASLRLLQSHAVKTRRRSPETAGDCRERPVSRDPTGNP